MMNLLRSRKNISIEQLMFEGLLKIFLTDNLICQVSAASSDSFVDVEHRAPPTHPLEPQQQSPQQPPPAALLTTPDR